MTRPTLFYHLHDIGTEQALIQLEGAKEFNKLRSVDDISWLAQLESNRIDVAIIELPRLSHEDYLSLIESATMTHIEFIFLSDGQPNPHLDKLMSQCAGYHFR